MAETSFGVNDALAVKLWSKQLEVEALKATQVQKFIGNTSNDLVQMRDETRKSAGDKITYGLRMQMAGDGVQGDGTLEGNEEALTTYSDAVLINQTRHASRTSGRMSQQRVPFDIRQEALDGLADWWANRLDTAFLNQICGNSAETNYVGTGTTLYTGNNAPVAPDSNHYISQHGSSDDSAITSSDTFKLALIDKAVERAKTLSPAIRPVRIGGQPWYVCFLHPYQVTDLRTDTNTAQWTDIQKAAMTGGLVKDNPIFTGALGVYNGVVLHADSRVTTGAVTTTAYTSVRRAVFCGAQSMMLAYGRDDAPGKYSWFEELFDSSANDNEGYRVAV